MCPEPQPSFSNIIKQEPTQSIPISPDWAKLITLNSTQTENLRYPSGISVRWNVMDGNNGNIYKEGTVNSVHLDMNSRELLYEVCSKHQGELNFFSENDLGYAPPCSLFVCPETKEHQTARDLIEKGENLLHGSLLFCHKVDRDWVYTVEIIDNETGIIKLLENVPSENVMYRRNTVLESTAPQKESNLAD